MKRIYSMILLVVILISFCYCQNPVVEVDSQSLQDIDGNVYKTVLIGDQLWSAENLRTTHYRNGDPIAHAQEASAWQECTGGAWSIYHNDPENASRYGYLYNGIAIKDNRRIAPLGWHVPTDEEWKALEATLGMNPSEIDTIGPRGVLEGSMLKMQGLEHWSDLGTSVENQSGFSALPSGYRNDDGSFDSIGYHVPFWSSTVYEDDDLWYRSLDYGSSQITRYTKSDSYGFPVRCIKDSD